VDAVGYIDSDSHIRETDRCWDYLDPGERHHQLQKDLQGAWLVDGTPTQGAFNVMAMPPEYNELFPEGSVDLAEPLSRIQRMDVLGIDVQVLFSTFWLNVDIPSADQEAALMRSWNRWMADRVAESNGRLLWTLEVPFRVPERAMAELEFGKSHGAAGIHLSGLRHGITVADPLYRPIYQKAQELGLVIAIHVGGDWRKYSRDPSIVLINNLAPVPGAFHALYSAKMPAQFPNLNWAFVEAGASWIPFALQEASRADDWGGYRVGRDWRDTAADALVGNNFFVSCQIDDDLAYLRSLVGTTNLVHGTDYGHMDLGSDPYGLHIIATRTDLPFEEGRAIVDSNARRLWGIDPSFTPAPMPELRTDVVEASRAWTN
jgi:predicted TIM-barrel fold metal-dependent hydrolase